MHRTFSCHWLEHTDIQEQVMTVRKLSGLVTQGSLTIDFSPVITPKCKVRDLFCDLGLDGVIIWEILDSA